MHGLFAVGYQHRSELLVRDRDWAHKDYLTNPQGGWSAAGNPSLVPSDRRHPADPTNPLGRLTGPDPRSAVRAAGRLRRPTATGAPVCYWQYSVYDALTEEEDRWQVYADYNVDITDSTSFHIEAMYADTEIPIYRTSPSYAALQPRRSAGARAVAASVRPVLRPAPTTGLRAPSWPTIRACSRTTANPGAILIANRPFALGGNPLFDNGSSEGPRNYDGYRLSTGLNGDISDSLSWDVAATYMEQNTSAKVATQSSIATSSALRGLGGPGCDTPPVRPERAAVSGTTHSTTQLRAIRSPVQTNSQFDPAPANNNRDLINWMFPIVSTDHRRPR